jgi:hypothetical protein
MQPVLFEVLALDGDALLFRGDRDRLDVLADGQGNQGLAVTRRHQDHALAVQRWLSARS